MPITIQEIIASDTISQLVDKTNFNFDQLLLNGGGPAGPRLDLCAHPERKYPR